MLAPSGADGCSDDRKIWLGSLGSMKAERMKVPVETEDWKAESKPVGWEAGPWRLRFRRSKKIGRKVPTPPAGAKPGQRGQKKVADGINGECPLVVAVCAARR